jgi:hypothetical protein
MYLCRGSPDFFFYFHIWTTEVIPYNALNSEFANLYIYLLLLIHLSRDCIGILKFCGVCTYRWIGYPTYRCL